MVPLIIINFHVDDGYDNKWSQGPGTCSHIIRCFASSVAHQIFTAATLCSIAYFIQCCGHVVNFWKSFDKNLTMDNGMLTAIGQLFEYGSDNGVLA